ncbi:MAG: hypothetical protein MMC23_009155 [Stictis urceolatum]|nr:hypothetical protein [Stictis urceolata]
MHRKDWDLFSINHLYKGAKIWIIISPDSIGHFETQMRKVNKIPILDNCSQFLRHNPLYIPTKVLEDLKVSYTIVRQNAGEALSTFPRAYHQGFSMGSSLAEAVNYAYDGWSLEKYTECSRRTCPEGFITREMMEFRNRDEQQWSAAPEDTEAIGQEVVEHVPQAETGERYGNRQVDIRRNSSESTDNSTETVADVAKRRTNSAIINVLRPRQKIAEFNGPSKRKYKGPQSISTSKKAARSRPRSREVSCQEVSDFFNEILSAPAVEPWDVYREFVQLGSGLDGGFDDSRALLLTRLFYAIGSPDAFCQLRDACLLIRNDVFQLPRRTEGIMDTIKALDSLEVNLHLTSIAKRYYLMSLCAIRDRLQNEYSQRPGRANRSFVREAKSDIGLGRAASQAIATMMAQAYPDVKPTRARGTQGKDEYGKKYDSLRQRLLAGQKWSYLVDAFAPGIIVLVPTQGDYQLSNTE